MCVSLHYGWSNLFNKFIKASYAYSVVFEKVFWKIW